VRRRTAVMLGLVGIALLAAACGGGGGAGSGGGQQPGLSAGQQAGQQQAPTVAADQIRRGGTLIVAMDANPENFDPMISFDSYSGAVVDAVTEGLYKYNERIEPVPWLAERVDRPDEVTYVFHIRRGVKFHDGTDLDAEAVRFSIERARNNQKSPGFRDGQQIAELTVTDPMTLRMVLKEPNAAFPSRLTGRLAGVVSPTAVRAMGDDRFALNPVGTGPFRFGEFKTDSLVRVTKFDNYWRMGADGRPLPYLDAVEWRIISEPASRLTALQAGDVHIASVRDQDMTIVRGDQNLVWGQAPGFSFAGFSLNIAAPPFDNKALRQAVAYAIDRDEIIKAIFEGNREFGNGPLPVPMAWAVDPNYKPYTYDPAKARQKLAEGGRPNGFEFVHWYGTGSSTGQQLVELIQAQLARVGITMRVEAGDFNGVVTKRWENREGNSFGVSWSTGIDPDQIMSGLFTPGGAGNYFPYDNPRVTELVLAARRSASLEDRGRAYKEAVPLIMEDSPYIFLTYGISRFTGNKRVQGWSIGPRATSSYSEYWLSER
jgi:ABC-type transport system substrate-binding protein